MRIVAKAVVIGAAALAFGTARVAQASISVIALAIDPTTPSTLYAGTYGDGVFRSTNSGGSWTAVNTSLSNLNVVALAIDPTTPSTLYAGTYGGGAFRSTNSGGSWTAVNTGLSNLNVNVGALAIDPTTPSTLYAGTSTPYTVPSVGGVYQSTNSGGSWTAVNTGLSNLGVYALAIDPTTPSTLYAGTAGDNGAVVYQSTNSGGSWSAVLGGGNYVYALAIDPTTPSTLYAGTEDAGVFQSTNSGGNWSASSGLPLPCSVLALAIDPTTSSTLYTGTAGGNGGGVYQSTNSGGSWSALNTGMPEEFGNNVVNVNALAIDPTTPSTLYAGTDAGVFQSTNSGGTWTAVNTGLSRPIPGRGKNGCMLEWLTDPAAVVVRNVPAHQLTCMDDNSACDFGATTGDHTCTFHVAMCLNVVDTPLLCSPSDVAQVQLLSPNEAKPKGAPATANRDALESALTGVGGTVDGLCANTGPQRGQICAVSSDCDSIPGRGDGVCKGRFVEFAPPLTADNSCTALTPIQLPLKQTRTGFKAASVRLNVKAISDPSARQKGSNSLTLTCKPHL